MNVDYAYVYDKSNNNNNTNDTYGITKLTQTEHEEELFSTKCSEAEYFFQYSPN